MKKIPTLFRRDLKTHLVTPEVTPGCEWVLRGEGRPTRKFDGACCLFKDGRLWKRREVRWSAVNVKDEHGGQKVAWAAPDFPYGFIPADSVDADTGKQPGWMPVGCGPEDQHFREAAGQGIDNYGNLFKEGATYELCGPSVNGNREDRNRNVLVPHGAITLSTLPDQLSFDSLRGWIGRLPYEGVVWWHQDGRMCKLKVRDFYPKGPAPLE
jgi:hypothetical protein